MNKKVPVAVLSCFLIAFLLQGILKMCGIFVFQKTLDWQIFEIIDNTLWLNIIYQIIINLIAVYCPSFALTRKPYSNKWYHYLTILIVSGVITGFRTVYFVPMYVEYLWDIVLYIGLPLFVNLTSDKDHRLFNKLTLNNFIILLSSQIILYFCYLGLCYWSSLLSSFIIESQVVIYASSYFLIFFELYIGLVLIMLSLNTFINNLKGDKL